MGFQGKGVRGRADKRLAGVDFFQNSRDDRIAIEPDLVILFSQTDNVSHMQRKADAVEYVLHNIDICRTFLGRKPFLLLKAVDDLELRLCNLLLIL